MRIRHREPVAVCSASSTGSSSSIAAAHSLASSQDSSSAFHFSPPPPALPRCRGLDLLVKAIHQVDAGSVVGVPYIQRRITIRRRRRSGRIEFNAVVLERRRGGISKSKKANKGQYFASRVRR